MAIVIRGIAPVAHLPLILGVLRTLTVATLVDTIMPPPPEHVLSCGRGVEALVRAILDGHHVLYKVGARLDERGMLPLLQPGLTRPSVHDTRLGQMRDVLCAAHLHRVFGAIALYALETYAITVPWMHQDTTTIALAPPVQTYGWLVLATTVDAHPSSDAEIVRAYRDQTTTVELGLRWIKNPAAISPVWLEKPERIAALALLTVVGLLVYGLIQRQVRQYLRQHQQSILGHKGDTVLPTAAVVLASFAQVTLVHVELDGTSVRQVHGW